MPAFKYVFIPADVDEEVQELTMEYTSENVVECLVNRLQKVRPRLGNGGASRNTRGLPMRMHDA